MSYSDRSVSEEDYALSQYQTSHHTHYYPQHHPQQDAPRYLQQHSSHYPEGSAGGSENHFGHQRSYPISSSRHSHCNPADAWWQSRAQHPPPPPPRIERHRIRTGRDVTGVGAASMTSCGSAEGSPLTGDSRGGGGYLGPRQHPSSIINAAWQPDPGSISEPCQPARISYSSAFSSRGASCNSHLS